MRAIFVNEKDRISSVYKFDTIEKIAGLCQLDKKVYTKDDILENPSAFSDVEVIFSTWGMSVFTEQELETALPSLRAVFYAAGTVQYFAKPFLKRGVKVMSAWAANAVPVAEYTVSQIILANKGFFATLCEDYTSAKLIAKEYRGTYGAKIGIIGAGMIGSLVCEMLKNYKTQVFVFDPFVSDDKAQKLGAEKVSLEYIFENCDVISNHLANNEQTKGMLCATLFEKMKKNATFINTGRGAQVIESDLVKILKKRPDITALLDVTCPEPPDPENELLTLKNCIITPHIAGSIGDEVYRMSEYMLCEFEKFIKNQKCDFMVSEKMLETMA